MNLDMLIESLTEEEKHFFKDAERQASPLKGGRLNLSGIMIEMYSIKHAEKNTKALINSNEKLAISTGIHADAMRHLTTALLIVASFQVILFAIQLWQSYQ